MSPEWQRWNNIMKCYPFEEKRLLKWEPPYIVQPKYDGVRCRALPIQTGIRGNEFVLLSSEENIIYSVPHINNILSNLGLKAELDGELYRHGMSFEQILSLTSRTVNIKETEALDIKYYVFDVVEPTLPQMRRTLIVENLKGVNPWIEVAPFWICETLDDVLRAFDTCISLGYEGIIVRHKNAPYVRKRSLFLMKFKPKKKDEYEIVDSVEEYDKDGNPKDRLGALVCKSNDGNLFKVGTGFTDDQRAKLWDIKEILPGNTAVIKYQHLTSGKKVPRFTVFVEVKYAV